MTAIKFVPTRSSTRVSTKLPWSRSWLRVLALWACLVLSVLPIVVTAIAALTKSWNTGGAFSGGLTMQYIVAAVPTYLPLLRMSLTIMSITLVLTILFGLPLAWLFARQRIPGGKLIGWFVSLPLSIPGIALGLALIATYSGLQSFGVLVIAGHVLLTTPFMIAALVPVLADEEQRDVEMVAMTLGASPARRFLTITLPHLRTAILSGALMVSAISLGEFNITYFVVSPASPTLPVGLFSAFIYGTVSDAASQTILYILAVLPIAILIQWIGKLLVKGSGR